MNNSPELAIFGYGSLVNKKTVSSSSTLAAPARLRGWVREWKHCVDTAEYLTEPFGKICVLTANRQGENAQIDGVVLLDSRANLEGYDQREVGYSREKIATEKLTIDLSKLPNVRLPSECYIYVSKTENHRRGNKEYPILRSYIDCVLAGFLEIWGREGVERFIDTTSEWDTPILDDREKPIYPRAVFLRPNDRYLIDEIINIRKPHLRIFSI